MFKRMHFFWLYEGQQTHSDFRRNIFVFVYGDKLYLFSFVRKWFHIWTLAGQFQIAFCGLEIWSHNKFSWYKFANRPWMENIEY